MDATTLPTLLLGGDPDGVARRDLRRLAGGPGPAVGPRPGGRPHHALPGRRRRRAGGRHRRVPGPMTDVRGMTRRRDPGVRRLPHAARRTTSRSRPAPPAGATRACGATAERRGDRGPAERRGDLVVPLGGPGRRRRAFDLAGRTDVFAGPTDVGLPRRGAEVVLASRRTAAGSPCAARAPAPACPPADCAAAEVPVELRGAGQCSRQVRNFGTPRRPRRRRDHRLRGDHARAATGRPTRRTSTTRRPSTESELEEIYYFEIAAGPNGEPGLGFFRTSSSPGHEIDLCDEVRDRDTVLVPYGWHGPCVAAPGHDMYYLNVMAGPGPGAGLEDHRPPRAGLGAGHLGRPAVDPRLDRREDS